MLKNEHREEQSSNSEILITKDLLGGLSCNSQQSADMGFKAAEAERLYHEIWRSVAVADNYKQDLNHPPEILKEKSSDLKLEESSRSWSNSKYQSVCTLEKVKNALQRDAEKERKRSSSSSSSSSSMFAAACPACLLYVVTLKTNPKCPRCNSTVSSSLHVKKPKFDLNSSSATI
ncbi:hypothetical protein LWI29_024736 [Acer saccharum]|uniref:GIR1-like zinc ribbon domain-containing protein n=1 Tax=Acer saccharum TaxID=4024 RepID=A0AA39RSM6_ACESA|nr:hypothetical protein LWI29_024736 [Acer saccharum]